MEAREVKAANVDDRRRVCLPPEIPAGSAVTFQRIDADTWVVRRQRPEAGIVLIIVPAVKRLPDDPEWEKVETAFTRHAWSTLKEEPAG
jgi:hypothetical protein